MTLVNLMLNLKAMLEKNFNQLNVTSRNKETEKQLLNLDSNISIDLNCYSKPNVFIGFRPVTINTYDFPAVVIVPPTQAKESIQEKEYDITFILSIKHNIKAIDNNACLEAVSFIERLKDIIFKNRLIGGFVLDFENISWGVDILPNAQDITVAEISAVYKSGNNYE